MAAHICNGGSTPAVRSGAQHSARPSAKQAAIRYALGAPKGARTQRAFIIIKSSTVSAEVQPRRARLRQMQLDGRLPVQRLQHEQHARVWRSRNPHRRLASLRRWPAVTRVRLP